MEKKFGWRRLLALLLAVSMVFSSQAFTALADGIALISDPNPIKVDTTYNLAEYPDWIQEWNPETQTGSRVSIQNSTNEMEQFLPADYIGGTKDYPEFVVKDGYGVIVDVYWTVPDQNPFSPVKNGTKFTYKLPKSITFGVDQKFPVQASGRDIGWATVDENGLVTVEIEFEDDIELHEFSAHFSLWGTMELEGKKKDEKVTLDFPEIGMRDVTVAEDVSSKRLGFTVSKGLVNFKDKLNGWGYDGKLESAVHYNDKTGLIDEIWYMVRVTANKENKGLLSHLSFDDAITNAWNSKDKGEDLKQYFTIDAERAQIVNLWKESIKNWVGWGPCLDLTAESVKTEDGTTHFEFDLSTLDKLSVDLNGGEEGNGLEPGLEPGDYITIIYPVIVDPKFWTKIPSGQTSESMVELSGVYGAENTITVKNEAGDTNTAKTNWSMQKEWLNKKGSVKMIDGKPYVHYEIYVYPTVSETLAGWLLEDDMEGQTKYEYLNNSVHIEFFDQANNRIGEAEPEELNPDTGYWKYRVPSEINGNPLVRENYLLISYDVLYNPTVSEKDEQLRNQISMTIDGKGPLPVGIESSYYSLDKMSLSKAEDVAKAAKSGKSPLEWKTVIGSITNASGSVATSESDAMIKAGSTFWDVLTSSGPNHYFTQTDIDGITLWSGEDENHPIDVKKGTDYDVYPAASITKEGDYTSCEPGENCKGFFIKFKNDVKAPVTVEYTSHSAQWNSGGSATYTNTSSFHPAEAGSTMSDAASLAFNETDYLAKLPQGINYEKGQAQWYFLLNQKNNLKFGLNEEKYTIEDVMPEGHTFAAAYVVPFRNASIPINSENPNWWEEHQIPTDKIEVTEEGRKAVIDVTEYLQHQQRGGR